MVLSLKVVTRTRNKNLRVMAMLCAFMCSPAVLAQMISPGSFAVGPSGAALYTIPIQVPPGVAGLEPKLALVYSSQSANGLAGVGWGLSGLSSITRCPKNLLQDGVRGIVNYSSNDRYCLDGQRLYAVTGSYGADKTEYRTEQEGFSQIISYAETGATDGPGSFVVKLKSGLTMEYGKTADSRVEAQGKTAVAVWALNKVRDAKGNSYSVTYNEDTTNGQYFPARIDYTANASASPALSAVNTVVFSYNLDAQNKPVRSDAINSYLGGAKSRTTALLTGISTTVNGVGLKKYTLTYDQSPGTLRSRLTKFQECQQATSSCSPALVLTWDNNAWPSLFTTRAATRAGGYWPGSDWWYVGDANGDGLPDLFHIFNDGGYISIDVHVNNGNGTVSLQRWATNVGGFPGQDQFFVTDINGDGRADVVHLFSDAGSASVDFIVNKPGSLLQNLIRAETRAGGIWSAQQWKLADVNGDGLPDLINIFDGGGGTIAIDAHVNVGGTSLQASRWATNVGGFVGMDQLFVADVNGDGLSDVVHLFNDGGYASVDFIVNQGGNLQNITRAETRAGGFWSAQNWQIADVNGDGFPDLINIFDGGGGAIAIDAHVNNGGNGLLMSRWATNVGGFPGMDKFFVADVNGDGQSDVVHLFSDNGNASIDFIVSDGQSLQHMQRAQTRSGGYWAEQSWQQIDSQGTGLVGLMNMFTESGQVDIDFHSVAPVVGDKIVSISIEKSSSDKVVLNSITYQALPQARISGRYAQTISGVYPRLVSTPPLQVASQVDSISGIGGVRSTQYGYGNFTSDGGASGRGSLGFQWSQTKDLATGLINRTCFRQDHPYIGMVSQSIQGTSDAGWPACGSFAMASTSASGTPNVLSLTTNTYAGKLYTGSSTTATPCGDSCTVAAGQRYFVYPAQSSTQSWDWDGTTFIALPQNRTSQTYDDWGNALTIKAETLKADGTGSGYVKTTTSQYATPDTTNWILGRVVKSTVQADAP